jgi:prophage antirepressor-like protein
MEPVHFRVKGNRGNEYNVWAYAEKMTPYVNMSFLVNAANVSNYWIVTRFPGLEIEKRLVTTGGQNTRMNFIPLESMRDVLREVPDAARVQTCLNMLNEQIMPKLASACAEEYTLNKAVVPKEPETKTVADTLVGDNSLQVFEDERFGTVRIVVIDDEPWFVGKDIAEILGYSNPRDALAKHVEEEDKKDGVAIRDTIGRMQKTPIINESGVYSLIFGSCLPKAKAFKRWVTSEVLPALRKTGTYTTEPMSQLDILAGSIQALQEQERKIAKLSKDVEETKGQTKALEAAIEEKSNALNSRIDSITGVNIQGTPRQRLKYMVDSYAKEKEIAYSLAWEDFKTSYNMAYKTNVVLQKTNYIRKHGGKYISLPDYLEKMNLLEDALRVAGKMLDALLLKSP